MARVVHAVSASLPMKVKYNPILERIKNSKDGSSFIIPFDANKLPMSFSKQFLGNGWREGRKSFAAFIDGFQKGKAAILLIH